MQNDFYEALYTQSKAKFGAYVDSGTLLNNYAHIFDLLTRLRQAVDHPYLILYGSGSEGMSEPASAARVCGICHEAVEDPVITGCRHTFCRLCMREYLESIGGSALSMLRDKTNDESAFIGDEGFDEEDDAATPAKSKRPKKKAKVTPAAVANGDVSGDAGAGVAVPTCPTCFAQLTVDLSAAPDAAASLPGTSC